nr:GAF domain-containing protein [Planctomycetota bacterium]
VGRIVVGKAPGPRWRELFARPLAERLVRRSGDIDVYVINGDQGDDLPTRRPRPQHPTRALLDWGVSSAVLIAVAAATSWLYPVITRVDRINVGLIYLVAVVLVAARSRRELTVFFAILAMLGAHALIRDLMPQGFQVQDTLAFGAILVVGLTVSALAVRVHHQLDSAYQREARTAALHAVSRDLATIRGIDAILAAVVRHSQAMFGCPVTVLLPDPLGRVRLRAGDPTRCAAGSPDAIAAQWAFANGRPAGLGTDTLRRCEALHVPLMASQGTVGVLSLFFITPRRVYSPERRNQVEAFAHQTALAIECDNLALRSQAAQLEVDAERLRNALLSSVSHDLRTPLAAITGAASTLVEHDALLDPQSRHDLALTISEVAENMARLVGNLLDMTRIEAGKLRLRSEPHPLADVVGSTMTMMERRLQGRTVEVVVPAVLPLVPLDGQLIQEVLVNLIDNAIKYAPAGSPLRVEAEVLPAPEGPGEVRLSVSDRGPGVTADERERIFEKFYRGAAQGHQAGVGLGLAICRAIVVAHGGRIWAENREGGGANFRFTLPLPIEPAATPAEAMPALAPIPEPLPSSVASVAVPPADGTVATT